MVKDEVYYKGKDETPEIEACLMHPMFASVRTSEAEGQEGYGGILFGLCEHCEELLRLNPTYQRSIDEEIKERVVQLKQRRES